MTDTCDRKDMPNWELGVEKIRICWWRTNIVPQEAVMRMKWILERPCRGLETIAYPSTWDVKTAFP